MHDNPEKGATSFWTYHPTFKEAILQGDTHALEKAIHFAVGNTLVCDQLHEAKRLGWRGSKEINTTFVIV